MLESLVILRTAVGITGAIGRDRANIDAFRSDHFGPRDCRGKKMGIAKRNVTGRNGLGLEIGFADRDVPVRQAGTTDSSQIALIQVQTPSAVMARNRFKSATLTGFGKLAVTRMQQGD